MHNENYEMSYQNDSSSQNMINQHPNYYQHNANMSNKMRKHQTGSDFDHEFSNAQQLNSVNYKGGDPYTKHNEDDNKNANTSDKEKEDNNNQMSAMLESVFESEKIIRSLQVEMSLAKLRKESLLQQLDQKKKQAEGIKADIKKIKSGSDKYKDQISVLTRENDFLHGVILFSSNK